MAISGIITVGGNEINITDADIIMNSVSYSMSSSVNGKFHIGSFNVSSISLTIFDDQASEHDFTDAVISLSEIQGGEGSETTTATGVYYVVGDKIRRKRNTVSLVGYDATTKFDIALTESEKTAVYTASTLLSAACSAARVSSANYSTLLSTLPNTDIELSLASPQIQSWRDAVIWCCQLICCNATIDRDGLFTLRRAVMPVSDDHILYDYTVEATSRIGIDFADNRAYIGTVSAYTNKSTCKVYAAQRTPTEVGAKAAEYAMPYNPLITDTETADFANMAWIAYTCGDTEQHSSFLIQREITAKLFSDPKYKIGDVIAFTGGLIDISNRIIGIVTDITHRYNGFTIITCRAPAAISG